MLESTPKLNQRLDKPRNTCTQVNKQKKKITQNNLTKLQNFHEKEKLEKRKIHLYDQNIDVGGVH